MATHTDQDEQKDSPLSTKLQGVRGRGRGRGRKKVTVATPNNAHSGKGVHVSLLYYLPFCMCVQTTAQILSTCLKKETKPGKGGGQNWQLTLIRMSRMTGLSLPSYGE